MGRTPEDAALASSAARAPEPPSAQPEGSQARERRPTQKQPTPRPRLRYTFEDQLPLENERPHVGGARR
eukprot:10140181-Alexandrium_andersonii.AAC.1